MNCFTCHGGERFTDSDLGGFHNVGTLKISSGQRLGGALTGLDTPTLRGVWATAPCLHDGSAPTLLDVLTTANPTNTHGATSGLTATQLAQLVAYLNQIDESEPAALPASSAGLPSFDAFAAIYLPPGSRDPLDNPDGDSLNNLLEYALGGSKPAKANSVMPPVPWPPALGTNDAAQFQFSFLRKSGGYSLNGTYRISDLEYTPQASVDLVSWSLAVVETPNPPGLPAPPVGYEWLTYKMQGSTNDTRAFERVKIELK